jgi:hypothetical protein
LTEFPVLEIANATFPGFRRASISRWNRFTDSGDVLFIACRSNIRATLPKISRALCLPAFIVSGSG